jgi:hypothetical protein
VYSITKDGNPWEAPKDAHKLQLISLFRGGHGISWHFYLFNSVLLCFGPSKEISESKRTCDHDFMIITGI